MKRILVLGTPGAGKSTFARRLGERLDLPVFHLDRYFWHAGWKATPEEEWVERQLELLSRPAWIIDGNYRRTIPLRLEYADTAVYLDVSRWKALWRVGKRIVTYRNRSRPDMADGCVERWFDRDFLRYIWRYHRDVEPSTFDLLEGFAGGPDRQVVRLRSDDDIEQWLRSLAGARNVNRARLS